MRITKFEPKRVDFPKAHQRFWDNHRQTVIVATNRDDGQVYVSALVGYNRNGTAYARVTVYGALEWCHGFGKAGGYGYCKQSAALYNAFRSIGIEIDGLEGTGAMRDAVEAVAMHNRKGVRIRVVEI